ncbi:hypothetical protein Ddye_026459 [Dipteronia dyeriana]|uniref:Pentatricopeptide repeat-containing protein n=1 Tax=Dipteronia dyeriana TaxID=168575 RepID=A0AAD9TM84_9ROSI|nr:hypothetical protein Ddye_026459 [Dipteronia dyeriana]
MLFSVYTDNGMFDKVIGVFDYREKSGFKIHQREFRGSKKLFEEMEKRGVRPNCVTYSALIDGYSKKGNLDEAKLLFEEMEKKGLRPNIITYSALIDGYSKKGNIKEAKRLYEEMVKRGL